MDTDQVTEPDLQELETFLHQTQQAIAAGYRNLRSPVDSSLSGEETASIDTGIGSSDEPCTSPLVLNKPPTERFRIPCEPKLGISAVRNTKRRQESSQNARDPTMSGGVKGTFTLRLVTEDSPFGTLTTDGGSVHGDGDVVGKGNGNGVSQSSDKVQSGESNKELMLSGKKAITEDGKSAAPPRGEVKAEDLRLFIPPPPPLSPSCEHLPQVSPDDVFDNAETMNLTVVSEITRQVELRISDYNMNPVNCNTTNSNNENGKSVDAMTTEMNKRNSGNGNVNIWEPRENGKDYEKSLDGLKVDSSFGSGKRKMSEESTKGDSIIDRNDNRGNHFKKAVKVNNEQISDKKPLNKNANQEEQYKKVDRSKLSLNLFSTSTTKQNGGFSGKKLSPIVPTAPKMQTLQLGRDVPSPSSEPSDNLPVPQNGNRSAAVSPDRSTVSPSNPAISPTTPLSPNVQSPNSTGPPVMSPTTTQRMSLLDAMHKKYYAHQYSGEKVQTLPLTCNSNGNATDKKAEIDPFEKMLPSFMSESLATKSGVVRQQPSNKNSTKQGLKSPVTSPVKEVNIVHTVSIKESKQKKSKHGIVSFGSFRNKIKPRVIENKHALVESPPGVNNPSKSFSLWNSSAASTLPTKFHENSKETPAFNGTQSLPKSKSDYAKLSAKLQNGSSTTANSFPTSQSAPDFRQQAYSVVPSRSVCESIPEHCSKEDLQDQPVVNVHTDSAVTSWLTEPVRRDQVVIPSSFSAYELSGGQRREMRAASVPNQSSRDDSEIDLVTRSYTVPRVHADLCLHNQDRTDRQHAEIEGVEACRWLRAAGFPQYAQMYEDLQFPIDIASVEKDHDFLDKDSIQSLFRRLNTLNKCASMKIEAPSRKTSEDSDEEELCALSDKWKYQRSSRRWSRLEIDVNMAASEQTEDSDKKQTIRSCSSNDSVLTDNDSTSQGGDESPLLKTKEDRKQKVVFIPGSSPEDVFTTVAFQRGISVPTPPHSPTSPSSLRRAASERVKGPSSILKRIENLTSNKRKKKITRDNVEISGPTLLTDCPEMQLRLQRLGCVDISPTSETLPLLATQSPVAMATDSGAPSPASTRSSQSEKSTVILNNNNTKLRSSPSVSSTDALIPHLKIEEAAETETPEEEFVLPADHKPGTFPKLVSNGYISPGGAPSVNCRTDSISLLGSESGELIRRRDKRRSGDDSELNRMSVYDNVPDLTTVDDPQKELDLILHGLFEDINGLSRLLNESSGIESDDPCMEELLMLGAPSSPQTSDDTQDCGAEMGSPCNHSEAESRSNTSEMDADRLSAVSVSSNQELSDQEIPEAKDDVLGTVVFRERRDSGVGSSLTREPSERRRPRIRWHSFQKSHRPSFNSRNLQISNVSAGQMVILKKLCLLKMTALMERYSPSNRSGWNWVMPKFIKKFKAPDYRDKNIFGVPLVVILQRTGQPLPQCILYAMRFLRRTATDAVGIFRKSGVRSRIQKLRNQLETNPDLINFDSLQAYDVADLLKQYFRELPECLLTNKLSETFMAVHQHIPADMRLEALQAAVMLLPDENREVLQSLLLFLSDMAEHSHENQMTASNLAVCFAPSLFHMCGPRSNQSTASPKRGRKNLGVPDQKELMEQKAAHECLTQMIQTCKQLFVIPEDTMMKCRFSYMEQGDPVSLEELIRDRNGDIIDFNTHIESWVQGLLKESRDKFKGWVSMSTDDNTELAYKKVGDGHPLRLWKCSADVEAPPVEVLNRILRERHLWDDDLLKWRVVEKLDEQTEVYQYVCNSMAPHPTRDFSELRAWRSDLPKGACVLVSSSIEHPEAPLIGGARGVVLASRWLIEPCGSGKSRLTHISRLDTRGRSPEWYNKSYGHLAANFVSRISDSFRLSTSITTEGPETKI